MNSLCFRNPSTSHMEASKPREVTPGSQKRGGQVAFLKEAGNSSPCVGQLQPHYPCFQIQRGGKSSKHQKLYINDFKISSSVNIFAKLMVSASTLEGRRNPEEVSW